MPSALLISYGGYPATPSSLTPDNGLANLAGALTELGWEPHVRDLGTVSFMRRMFPQEITRQLRARVGELMAGGEAPSAEQVEQLRTLSAAVEAHQQRELDLIAEELAEEVRRLRPEFVGMKLWNGDGFTGSVHIAEHLRSQFPNLPIHAGGPQCSWWGEAIFRHTKVFTTLTHGEGERVIQELAEHALGRQRLSAIPGLIYLEDGQVRQNQPDFSLELDDLPMPVYDEAVYPAMAGDEKIKIIVLDDSRGCPYRCAFCMHPIESGGRLRTASAELLVSRMEAMRESHGITAFRFAGSSTPGELMAKVAELIVQRGLQVRYTCFGHFRSARPDHFELMARSGLHAIFYGIESGCQEVLDKAVGKKLDLQTVRDTIRAAQQAGVFVVASMIVPLPFDTEETMAESLEFLKQVRPDSVPVQFPGVIPPTPWGQNPEAYGFAVDEEEMLRVGLGYKIKLLFPPALWDPLPYRLNDMDFRQFTALTMRFAAELERAGILVGVPDDNALIAHCAGMSPREFRDRSRVWCTIGDADAVGEMVATANARILA